MRTSLAGYCVIQLSILVLSPRLVGSSFSDGPRVNEDPACQTMGY